MPPDFNRDGSWNRENPESRRYRYVSGIVAFRRSYPNIGPKALAERMTKGPKWGEMSSLFNPTDIAHWMTVESPDGWGFVRCSTSAGETIRAATRERDSFKRSGMPAQGKTDSGTALHPDWESKEALEARLEESGW